MYYALGIVSRKWHLWTFVLTYKHPAAALASHCERKDDSHHGFKFLAQTLTDFMPRPSSHLTLPYLTYFIQSLYSSLSPHKPHQRCKYSPALLTTLCFTLHFTSLTTKLRTSGKEYSIQNLIRTLKLEVLTFLQTFTASSLSTTP